MRPSPTRTEAVAPSLVTPGLPAAPEGTARFSSLLLKVLTLVDVVVIVIVELVLLLVLKVDGM